MCRAVPQLFPLITARYLILLRYFNFILYHSTVLVYAARLYEVVQYSGIFAVAALHMRKTASLSPVTIVYTLNFTRPLSD